MDIKQTANNIPKLLVSKRCASEALGVSIRTIEIFIARKELPTRKIGRRTLIPFNALRRFAAGDHRIQGEQRKLSDADEPLRVSGNDESTTDRQGED